MNENKSLFGSFLFSLLLGFSPLSQATPIKVVMNAAIDENCDGVAETTTRATPGSCIIYTLTTTNTGVATVYNLQINGQVPRHTQIFQQLWLDHDIFAYPGAQVDPSKRYITVPIEKLETGSSNALVLQYAVKIEE